MADSKGKRPLDQAPPVYNPEKIRREASAQCCWGSVCYGAHPTAIEEAHLELRLRWMCGGCWDDELATEVAWVLVYLSALSETAVGLLVKSDTIQLLFGRLAASESLQLLIPMLCSLGNLVADDSFVTNTILIVGHTITDHVITALTKCLKSEHRVLKKLYIVMLEAAWVLSNIAAGSLEHKELIYSSEATPALLHLLSTAPFDIRKEAAFVLGNLCVVPAERVGQPSIIPNHLVSLVNRGCLPGFINLVRSPDIECARLGLQFLELVMRGMRNGEGTKIVEREDGIEAMERFQFHDNEEM